MDGALIRAWEMTLRSPQLWRLGQFYVTYSNQIAEQRGNIIGGFTCSISTDPACDLGPDYTPVDHDQRNTLNTGFTANLPTHTWFASNVYYGSGFSNGLAGSGEGPYQGTTCPCTPPSMSMACAGRALEAVGDGNQCDQPSRPAG